MDSGFFGSGLWISDSNHYWDSKIVELYSGYQDPRFQIQQAKVSGFRILQGKLFQIPESGFPYLGELIFFFNYMYGLWSRLSNTQTKTEHLFTFFKERFMCSFMLFLAVKKIPIYAATISISGTTKNAKVLKMDTSFQSVNLFSSALKMASIQDNIIPAKIVPVGDNLKLEEGHWNKEIQSYLYWAVTFGEWLTVLYDWRSYN